MEATPIIVSLVMAYLCGSIPTGYWLGLGLKGIDIRAHGSGNMGATNVFRTLGKGPGIAVLVIDICKGVLPLTVVADVLGTDSALMLVVIGLTAVAGHNWTIFLRFKGGKGVATSLGVLIGLAIQIPGMPLVLWWTVLSWVICFLASGFVSLASIVASVVLPILTVTHGLPFPIEAMAILLCIIVVLRHRANISRLIKGQENRVKLPYFK